MATVTGLRFNVNTSFSGTGINQARRAVADFDEEQRRQNRMRATTAAAQARLDQQEAAARQAALRRQLDAQLRMREAAWQQELARRQAALDAQAEAERRHLRQVQDNFKSGWANVAQTVTREVTSVANAALGLGPALIPIVTASAGVAGGLVAAAAAGGLAAGVFGGALFGAIKATNSATSGAQKALEKQKDTLAGLTPGTKAYAEQVKKVHEAEKNLKTIVEGLTPVQQKYVKATAAMKGAWGSFVKETEKDTLTPVSIVFNAIARNASKLIPIVKAVSPLITRVARDFAAWMDGPGLTRFVDTIVKQGVPALGRFIDTGQKVIGVLGKGFRDFLPFGQKVVKALADGAGRLKDWSDGGGFTRFLEKVKEVAPDVKEFLKSLATTMKNFATAVGGLSGDSLSVVIVFFKVLASLPPSLLETLIRLFLIWRGALVVYAIASAIAATATFLMSLSLGTLSVMLIAVIVQFGLILLAVIALGVGIYFLVKYWDTVWNAIKSTAMTVWNWLTNGLGQLALIFLGPVGGLILLWQNWDTIWGWIADKVGWIYTTIIKPIGDFFVWLYNFLVGNSVIPDLINGIIYWFNFLLAPLKIAIDFVVATVASAWTGIQAAWAVFWATFGPVFTAAWTGLAAVASTAWSVLVAAWQFLWTTIVAAYQVGWAILSGAWQVGWAALTGAARVAWSLLTGAWSVLWTTVTGVWNVFYATFRAIFSGAWNVIVAAATGIWNILKAAWQVLWTTVNAIFQTFMAVFTGNWGAAWRAIQAAGAAIWNLIKAAWQAFLNVLSTAFTAFAAVLTAAYRAAWTGIQAIGAAAWAAIRAAFQAFLTALQTVWNAAWTAIRNIFQTLINSVITIAAAAWNTLRNAAQAFITGVTGIWNTGWTAIRNFFQTAVNAIVTAANTFWTAIRTAFSAGSTWLRETFWNPVQNFFTKTIPGAFEAGSKALGKAWDAIKKLVRAPIQAVVDVVYNGGIVKLWNAVAGIFGADKLSEFKLPQFKEGGPTGSGSSSGFPAVLHPNEHVWTSDEVKGAGGHAAVAALRSQAMGGAKVRTYGSTSFDEGGGFLGSGFGPSLGDVGGAIGDAAGAVGGAIGSAVGKLKDLALGAISGPFGAAVDAAAKLGKAAVRKVIPGDNTAMEKLGVGMVDKIAKTVKDWVKTNDVAPDVGGGSAADALTWAKTQVGKPYQWGAVGPAGYDCSGFMSAIQNVIDGRTPNMRRWATGAFRGGTAPGGWKREEKAPFMVGITNSGVGHTAGTLNGTNVEASGGAGVRVGKSARGYKDGMFSDWYGYMPSKDAGHSSGDAKATAKAMLKKYGWGTDQWSGLEALWTRESGWNPKAKNAASGAYGIPQALPASKMASAGKDWKTNATTQIKWGLGYIKGRYGSPNKANAFQKSHNWYGLGTPGASRGPAIVGEHEPEFINLRGGERIDTLSDLVGNGGGGGDTHVSITVNVQGNLTPGAVDRLENSLVPKLKMALQQKTGTRR